MGQLWSYQSDAPANDLVRIMAADTGWVSGRRHGNRQACIACMDCLTIMELEAAIAKFSSCSERDVALVGAYVAWVSSGRYILPEIGRSI